MSASATDKLISHIHEYHQLLGFLFKEYPQILEKWKNKNAAGLPDQQTGDTTNSTIFANYRGDGLS